MSPQPKHSRFESNKLKEKTVLTTEEREILRATDEANEFKQKKAKWEIFYEKMIKPSVGVPYQDHI